MKKILVIVGVVLFGLTSPVFAGELEELKLRLESVSWEFRYCIQRSEALRIAATNLQKEIGQFEARQKLEAQKAMKEKAQKVVPEKKIEEE